MPKSITIDEITNFYLTWQPTGNGHLNLFQELLDYLTDHPNGDINDVYKLIRNHIFSDDPNHQHNPNDDLDNDAKTKLSEIFPHQVNSSKPRHTKLSALNILKYICIVEGGHPKLEIKLLTENPPNPWA